MARKIELSHDFPDGLTARETNNCTVMGNVMAVVDRTREARLVLADELDEYVVTFLPNFGWVWGE